MGWILLVIVFCLMFPELILPLLGIYLVVAYAIALWPLTLVILIVWIMYKCISK